MMETQGKEESVRRKKGGEEVQKKGPKIVRLFTLQGHKEEQTHEEGG